LVITDYNMPNMNGYEFLTEMRKNKNYKNIPVAIISSEWIDISEAKWQDLDVATYIKKPFEEKKIINSINNIFKEG